MQGHLAPGHGRVGQATLIAGMHAPGNGRALRALGHLRGNDSLHDQRIFVTANITARTEFKCGNSFRIRSPAHARHQYQ